MLETNILLQLFFATICSVLFIIILESFGYLTSSALSKMLRRQTKTPASTDGVLRLIAHVFVGGVTYTLFFLALGLIGLLSKEVVLLTSCLIPIVVFLLARRWRSFKLNTLRATLSDSQYIYLGSIFFLMLTFVMWFRPATNFDATWYHLTISKLFLQNHNVIDQGVLVRYSLQPTITYFLGLWPLSLPISTAVASIIINTVQAFLLALSLVFATRVGALTWGWTRLQQFAAPMLVGGTYLTLSQLGMGGSDIAGVAYGLVASLYCFHILKKISISWHEFIVGTLLIVGLASLKIFFTIFAVFVFLYFIICAWGKLQENKRTLKLVLYLLAIFTVTYLPWIVRSYIATGRLLDPVGAPGLNEEIYIEAGGGNVLNHWTNFIFGRFYSSIIPVLTFIYSPLLLAGVLSVFYKPLKREVSNLGIIAFVGFWVVFFASLALQWRYYLPPATILVFLGLASLIYWIKGLDAFGKSAVWSLMFLLVLTSCVRAVYTKTDSFNDPSIEGDLYARHFTTTDNYLNNKVSKYYGYVQQKSPSGLTSKENILVANTYSDEVLAKGIHNLAYMNNPYIEPTINKDSFSSIRTVSDLKNLLEKDNVRYLVARDTMSNFCKSLEIRDYKLCQSSFEQVLTDNEWSVKWYKVKS